jgi:hypothetical protein
VIGPFILAVVLAIALSTAAGAAFGAPVAGLVAGVISVGVFLVVLGMLTPDDMRDLRDRHDL